MLESEGDDGSTMKPYVVVMEEGSSEPAFYRDGKKYAFDDIKENVFIAQMAKDRNDR